jgi:hypothetical protein
VAKPAQRGTMIKGEVKRCVKNISYREVPIISVRKFMGKSEIKYISAVNSIYETRTEHAKPRCIDFQGTCHLIAISLH